MDQANQTNRAARWLSALIGFVLVVCGIYVFLTFVGYGKLVVTAPAGSIVKINSHQVASTPQKLRAGTYTVSVQSSKYVVYQQDVKVRNFLTTTLEPKLAERNPDAIISSVIGSYGYFGPPEIDKVRWFDNDTWLAGSVGPGSASQVALRYVNGSWAIAYFNGISNYPTELKKLPTDVAAYINQLQRAAKNAT